MACYSAHITDFIWKNQIMSIHDLVDARVGVLRQSLASRTLHALVPGARSHDFTNVQDMIVALQSRQVNAILHYEWEVRFALGTKELRNSRPHGLVLMPYAFFDRYYAFRVSPVWVNRSHFNTALAHVLAGSGEYGGSYGTFQANWTAEMLDTYEMEEIDRPVDLAVDYNDM